MAYTTPAQRMTDLESEVFQGVHQTQRLTADVAALRDQGKLHNELLAEAMKDLRDMRIEMADFKTEVRSSFAKVNSRLDGVDSRLESVDSRLDTHTVYFVALFKHLGVELPAAAAVAGGE